MRSRAGRPLRLPRRVSRSRPDRDLAEATRQLRAPRSWSWLRMTPVASVPSPLSGRDLPPLHQSQRWPGVGLAEELANPSQGPGQFRGERLEV